MRSLATARETVLFTVPGPARGQRVDIVFAVYLQSRRPAIRTAVLDADTDEVLGPAGTASLPLSRRL
jgi:hypothetical protein